MKKMFLVTMCVLVSTMTSCIGTGAKKPDIPPTPAVQPEVKTDLGKEAEKVNVVKGKVAATATDAKMAADIIKTESDAIITQTDDGKKVAPKLPNWDKIALSAATIDANAEKVVVGTVAAKEQVKELAKVEVTINTAEAEMKAMKAFADNATKELADMKAKIAEDQKTIQDYETGVKKQQQMIWMYIAGLAAIGMVVGVFLAIYVSQQLGISLGVACLVIACMSYFMAAYAWLVAILGGVIVCGIIGYLIIQLAIHRKAIVESVCSFEYAKDKLWTDPAVKTNIDLIQSESTKKLVQAVKWAERIV